MDADSLVKAYVKIRDAKDALTRKYDADKAELDEALATIEESLLELCKTTGQEGGKTNFGTFSRTVKTRYWTSDWDSFYKVVMEHNAPQLLEQRISQGNFKSFLEANPEAMPEGVNVDRKYAITVRRPAASSSAKP
ncbi:MAG: hypothetical protein ABFD94_05015 [Armatimonadia bacterium]